MKMLLIIINLVSFSAAADVCKKASIRYIFDKKPVYEKAELCQKKTPDNMLFYLSASCANDKCDILKKYKSELVIKDYRSNIGSPGFKLCQELGGVPQIFEFSFSTDGLWQSAERCLFGKIDFVEISYLTREWKPYIK